MSRFLIWMVTGVSTVSLVTFTKSARTSKGIKVDRNLVRNDFLEVLELHCRRLVQFRKLLQPVEFFRTVVLRERPLSQPLEPPLKRLALLDMPCCSYRVRPALGV